MKSTDIRNIYAEALDRYRREVPIEQWPIYGSAVSRSGLARALQSRGFGSFERKRLESSKCRPILREMDAAVKASVADTKPKEAPKQDNMRVSNSAEVRQLRRRITHLETELRNTERREAHYRERCAVLEAEVEMTRRQYDAFEEHCVSSLRTLHV